MAWPLPFQTSRERPVTVNDINGPGPSPGRISTVSSSQKKNSFGFRNISWNHFLGFPEMGETRWMVDLVDFMDNTIYKSINERWLGVALWLRKPPFWDIVGTLPGGWFGRGADDWDILGYPGIWYSHIWDFQTWSICTVSHIPLKTTENLSIIPEGLPDFRGCETSVGNSQFMVKTSIGNGDINHAKSPLKQYNIYIYIYICIYIYDYIHMIMEPTWTNCFYWYLCQINLNPRVFFWLTFRMQPSAT